MTQAPVRRRPAPKTATVVRAETLSPTLTRVVLGGAELAAFEPLPSTDSYVKLSFLVPDVDYPRPLDMEYVRAQLPPEHWPVVRSYTVRAFDPTTHELTIDFVVHGDAGVAGPWAARARPGDEVLVAGPGGGYTPDPNAGYYLYIGDESALPAIAAALETLPAQARGHVVIEVPDAASEIAVGTPAGVELQWVHTGDRPIGQALVDAARSLQFPVDTVDAFVHGEAGFVKHLRRWLRVERGVAKERLSISGYWRLGVTDEGWRAGKADWNREAEEVEKAAGLT